jgi:manganese-dependent ADP-ribose/CDP-alcohol diphosphatase
MFSRTMRGAMRIAPAISVASICGATALASGCDGSKPLFSFGLIADIQYCDCDDASNFAGTEVRKYRGTLQQTRRAVDAWTGMADIRFVAQLGDLIDGQNAGKYGAGLGFSTPQSNVALGRVTDELVRCKAPVYHAVGNHELYNFDWVGLRERLQQPERGWRICDQRHPHDAPFHFSWRLEEGWTFVMLNCYAVSVEQEKGSPGYEEAVETLRRHNPRCHEAVTKGLTGVDYFAGVEDETKLRYVPFNGGLGSVQLNWLKDTVREAVARGDRVVVFGHLPMLPEAASQRTLLYDADEALEILQAEGRGHVVAVIAGHLHRGGFAKDASGIHHLTVQSPLNFVDCYGHASVYKDRLEIVGNPGGEMRSYSIPLIP